MLRKQGIRILCLMFSILFVLTTFSFNAFAASTIDATEVLKDLSRLRIDYTAKKFNKDTEEKTPKLVYFLEYAYDYNGDQNDYGLYVYIFNPSGEVIERDSELNTIQLSTYDVSGKMTASKKYRLQFISYSTESGYDHLFYKFKVKLDSGFVSSLVKAKRSYCISDLEIKYPTDRNARMTNIESTYTYTGFQEYHGVDNTSAHSTLSYESNTLETISVELHPASWKTISSDKGEHYQYEVSSVYFSIPNYYLEKYGDISDENFKGLHSVDMEWYEYKINGLITDNVTFADLASEQIGKSCTVKDPTWLDTIVTNESVPFSFYTEIYKASPFGDPYYERAYNLKLHSVDAHIDNTFPRIHNVFNYTTEEFELIGTEQILNSIYGDKGFWHYGNVDSGRKAGHNEVTISVDDKKLNDLIGSYASTHNDFITWLNSCLTGKGNLNADKEGYDPINPIHMVTSEDVNLIYSDKKVSDDLFISEGDVDSLRGFYTSSAASGKTTYLMRFAVTDYFCSEVVAFDSKFPHFLTGAYIGEKISGNHYFMEKTIFKDFDVINFTFKNPEGGYVTVPASSKPITIVGVITPEPGKPSGDGKDLPKLGDFNLIFILICGLLILFVLQFILKRLGLSLGWLFGCIGRFISWLFSLPGKAFNAINNSIDRKLDRKEKRSDIKLKENENIRRDDKNSREESKDRRDEEKHELHFRENERRERESNRRDRQANLRDREDRRRQEKHDIFMERNKKKGEKK